MNNSDDALKELYKQLIENVTPNSNKDVLHKTPTRAARAFRHLTSGYTKNLAEIVNGAIYPSDYQQIVILKDIEFHSLCEHHLLPFMGKCHVGYIPNGKIIGLSKIARIVDMFARRFQTQEALSQQIAQALHEAVEGLGSGVVINATHTCMMMRGVEKQYSTMTTYALTGELESNVTKRAEFFNLLDPQNKS